MDSGLGFAWSRGYPKGPVYNTIVSGLQVLSLDFGVQG